MRSVCLLTTLAAAPLSGCTKEAGYAGRSSAEWIRQLADSDNEARVDAADALGRVLQLHSGLTPVRQALIRALDDTAFAVRLAAGMALATDEGRSSASARELATTLRDSLHVSVRVSAANLLGMVQTDKVTAATALVAALRDPEPDVRMAAAESLGRIGAPSPGVVLGLVGLVDGGQPGPKVKAVEVLSTLGASPEIVLPAFVRALDDSSASVRAAASRALGALGPQAIPALDGLVRRLTDSSHRVRALSANAIGRMGPGGARAIPALIALQQRDTSVDVLVETHIALAAIRGQPKPASTPR